MEGKLTGQQPRQDQLDMSRLVHERGGKQVFIYFPREGPYRPDGTELIVHNWANKLLFLSHPTELLSKLCWQYE